MKSLKNWFIAFALIGAGIKVIPLFSDMMGPVYTNDRKTAAKTTLNLFKTPLGTYYLDAGTLPSTQQGLKALCQRPVGGGVTWGGPYLSGEIPRDPWGQSYHYRRIPGGARIWSDGPSAKTNADDIVVVLNLSVRKPQPPPQPLPQPQQVGPLAKWSWDIRDLTEFN